MKRMICELCECNEFVKDGGMFICQGCGTKYTLAEAKALMQECEESTAAPVITAAPVAPAVQAENLLVLADSAIASGNFQQAGGYADKILEKDGSCVKAWLIKAACLCGQTNSQQPRTNEIISCWTIALKHTPENEQASCRQQICQQAEGMLRGMVDDVCRNFQVRPNRMERDCVIQMCDALHNYGSELQEKLQLDVDMAAILAYTAEMINGAAVAGSNVADNTFGSDPSRRTKAAWERWMAESDNCAMLLGQAMPMAATAALVRQMHENYKIIINNTINSCSLKRDYYGNYIKDYALSFESVQSRKKMIAENINVMNRRLAVLNEMAEAEKEKEEALRRERIEAYWQERPEMKAQMDAKQQELEQELEKNRQELEQINIRQAELSKQIRQLENEKNEPVKAQVVQNEIIAEIKEIQAKWQNLGMFKSKEKRELEEQYETKAKYREALKPLITEQVAQQTAKIAEQLEPLQAQTKELQSQASKLKASNQSIQEKLKKLQAYRENID